MSDAATLEAGYFCATCGRQFDEPGDDDDGSHMVPVTCISMADGLDEVRWVGVCGPVVRSAVGTKNTG